MDRCFMAGSLGVIAVVVLLSGCSSPQGKSSFLHEGNCLTSAARCLRCASFPSPDLARELNKEPAEPYIVEPGDVLLVQPANLDSPVRLPGDQVVLPDGTIQLGRFGRFPAVGKTVEQIEVEINQLIRKQTNDPGPITVRLVTRDSKVFYVLGEVNAPGAFPLRGRETVLDAIVAAGGLNSNANRKGILLSRPTNPCSCRIVLPVEYNEIVQLGDTTTNYQIRAGDRVFVPCKSFCEDLASLFKSKKPVRCTPPVPCVGPELAVIETPCVPTAPAKGPGGVPLGVAVKLEKPGQVNTPAQSLSPQDGLPTKLPPGLLELPPLK